MPSSLIIVDRREDFRWPQFADRVVTADELIHARAPAIPRLINLCRSYRDSRSGYAVALIAEAHRIQAMPAIGDILASDRREWREVLTELVPLVDGAAATGGAVRVSIYFGETGATNFRDFARCAFARLRCPLLRVELEPGAKQGAVWHVRKARPLRLDEIPPDHDAVFLKGLSNFLDEPDARRKPHPAKRRFQLAVLHDPTALLTPTKPKTLTKLRDIGGAMGIDVVPIRRPDFRRLHRYGGLFIRETTAISNHTYRFACEAERLGIPVLDDPTSIVRCSSKLYLTELFRRGGVSIPKTRYLTHQILEATAELEFPVVVKIPHSSFSKGVERAFDRAELVRIARRMLRHSDTLLLQDFVQTSFDWRIGVLDGEPLFAARYHMCDRHWQILKHASDGSYEEGPTEAIAVGEVPAEVLGTALRAARLVGDGLYGVDLKHTPHGVFVMEVNDNPNIDVGLEDAKEGDELYRRLFVSFLRRSQMRARRPVAAGLETIAAAPRLKRVA